MVTLRIFRLLAASLTSLIVLLSFANDADAQRRRRRRRRRPPATAPANPPEPAEAEGTEGATPPETEEVATEEPAPPAEAPEVAVDQPAETPEAPPAMAETVPSADAPPDLTPLRDELAALMDEPVQTRARVAVLGRLLFETKVRIRVQNRAGDSFLEALSLRLDGAPVFVMEGRIDEEGSQVFEGFAAPGPHEITVESEQRARANSDYRYLQSDRYRFEVLQGQLTDIVIILDEDSDIAEDFEDDGEGEYDVRTRVRVATRALEDAP